MTQVGMLLDDYYIEQEEPAGILWKSMYWTADCAKTIEHQIAGGTGEGEFEEVANLEELIDEADQFYFESKNIVIQRSNDSSNAYGSVSRALVDGVRITTYKFNFVYDPGVLMVNYEDAPFTVELGEKLQLMDPAVIIDTTITTIPAPPGNSSDVITGSKNFVPLEEAYASSTRDRLNRSSIYPFRRAWIYTEADNSTTKKFFYGTEPFNFRGLIRALDTTILPDSWNYSSDGMSFTTGDRTDTVNSDFVSNFNSFVRSRGTPMPTDADGYWTPDVDTEIYWIMMAFDEPVDMAELPAVRLLTRIHDAAADIPDAELLWGVIYPNDVAKVLTKDYAAAVFFMNDANFPANFIDPV